MHIYIEKEFLDNFYLDYNEQNSVKKMVYSLLTEYPETEWHIDSENLEELKQENEIFAQKAIYFMPIPVTSIKDSLFRNQDFRQTVVFTQDKKDWFTEAEKNGVLCFDFDSYEDKISKIINNCRYKIDLSEPFSGWNSISADIPFNKIIVNDSYILTNRNNQQMDNNIFPLLKALLQNKENNDVKVEVFTSDFNPPPPRTPQQIREKAEERKEVLENVFANYKVKFKIINNKVGVLGNYDFHDRTICNNFQIIECGKGFNLIPHTSSNSQIISETIFDKYTYKRLKNHLKMYDEYFSKLETIETLNFKFI